MLSALTGSLRWATGVGPASTTGVGARRWRGRRRTATGADDQSDRDRGGQRADAGQGRSTIGGSHRGRHASTGSANDRPTRSDGGTRPCGLCPDRGSPTPGATGADRLERDRIEHELDVAMPSRAYARSASASGSGSPETGGRRPCAGSPWSRPAPPGNRTRTATVRSTSPGSRPTSRQASSTSARRGATPEAALPVSLYQPFQASACAIVARSIRGPFDPIMSGGPAGRGPRGSSSQSRAWYQRPSKSTAPSRRRLRMIVNASSKRSMRWSNG